MNKINKTLPLILIAILALSLTLSSTALAADSEGIQFNVPSLPNPLDLLENDVLQDAADSKGIGTTVPSLPKLPGFKDIIAGTSGNAFSELINTDAFSSDDISGTLKAVAVLAINLFLIVIQTVAGILKVLLSFLS
ncbi:MAG: hypothetical protein WD898_01855 [Candidatus Paceibacterota bacterium]